VHSNFDINAQAVLPGTTEVGMVTHTGEGRVLGIHIAIAYCTNASRGLSATAELFGLL